MMNDIAKKCFPVVGQRIRNDRNSLGRPLLITTDLSVTPEIARARACCSYDKDGMGRDNATTSKSPWTSRELSQHFCIDPCVL